MAVGYRLSLIESGNAGIAVVGLTVDSRQLAACSAKRTLFLHVIADRSDQPGRAGCRAVSAGPAAGLVRMLRLTGAARCAATCGGVSCAAGSGGVVRGARVRAADRSPGPWASSGSAGVGVNRLDGASDRASP